MDEELVERVLLAVEQIPPGRVAAYGDLAGLVQTGPRQVGAVMSRHGGQVTWWRVVNASGELPAHLLDDARQHWLAEGIELSANGRGCRIARHRCDLAVLADAYDAALMALTSPEGDRHPPCSRTP